MSKKGSFEISQEMLKSLFEIFSLIIVVVIIAVIVGYYVNAKVDTIGIESNIIIDKVLMEQGCLNVYDGRWIAYSIDIGKFNSDNLDFCLSNNNIGLDLKLVYNNRNVEARYNERMLDYDSFCKNVNNNIKCASGKVIVKVLEDEKWYDGSIDYNFIKKNE